MNLNPTQFGKVGGAIVGGAAGLSGGLPGAAAGAYLGSKAGPVVARNAATGASNVGNVAGGALSHAASGAAAGFKHFGPLGAIVGGEAGAVRGAASSAAGHNVLHGMGTGAKWGALGGPVGAAAGAVAGGIAGLFHHRGASTPNAGAAAPSIAEAKPGATSAGSAYTIKRGDNLSSIAASHGTTLDAVRKANPEFASNPKYKNGNMIFSGGKVNLPGAKAASSSSAPTVPNRATPQRAMVSPSQPSMMGKVQNMPYNSTTPASPTPLPNASRANKTMIQPL
jgi:hypothetical protein